MQKNSPSIQKAKTITAISSWKSVEGECTQTQSKAAWISFCPCLRVASSYLFLLSFAKWPVSPTLTGLFLMWSHLVPLVSPAFLLNSSWEKEAHELSRGYPLKKNPVHLHYLIFILFLLEMEGAPTLKCKMIEFNFQCIHFTNADFIKGIKLHLLISKIIYNVEAFHTTSSYI